MQYYKHVVHSVEKFTSKAPADHKLAGIYVMDAIIRNSQHKSKDKDIYAPRFAKNIVPIFESAYSQCPEKDKVSVAAPPKNDGVSRVETTTG